MVISLTVSPSVVFTSVARKGRCANSMQECYFRSREAPKPLNRFARNLARLTMSAVRPCKIWWPPQRGGVMTLKLQPRVLFSGSFNAPTAYQTWDVLTFCLALWIPSLFDDPVWTWFLVCEHHLRLTKNRRSIIRCCESIRTWAGCHSNSIWTLSNHVTVRVNWQFDIEQSCLQHKRRQSWFKTHSHRLFNVKDCSHFYSDNWRLYGNYET